MPLLDEIQAKDALIKKQRDVIAKYLILDIEDFLAEAREKEAAEAAAAYELALAEEKARSRWVKWKKIYKLQYDGVSVRSIIYYNLRSLWESWGTNPYHLHAAWYAIMLTLLLLWLIGSIICGYYEAKNETGSVRMAKLCRGILGSIPPIVQFILFLFPPLFVQF
ncbi:hypothetical protein G6011_01733 [Alternaria panax]|uniref:Uncharacterized protein n=1 Tax=Alternaria panax TaxID=48097 RepID=A0AAD4NVU4_9PLEO|nr:hypothetical protein G6011_01733 [Alternaria panax]